MEEDGNGREMARLLTGAVLFSLGIVFLRICCLATRADSSPLAHTIAFCVGAALCIIGILVLVGPALFGALRPRRGRRG